MAKKEIKGEACILKNPFQMPRFKQSKQSKEFGLWLQNYRFPCYLRPDTSKEVITMIIDDPLSYSKMTAAKQKECKKYMLEIANGRKKLEQRK